MKKIICMIMLVAILMSCVICVQAAGTKVAFTSGSSFVVGGTATVDLKKTTQNVMNDGSVKAEVYNAALEGNMTVLWKCANGLDKYGQSITWTADDVGKEYFCRINFYSDKECSDFVGYTDGDPVTITALQKPTILTTEKYLPEAVADQNYSLKLKCSDPNAVFEVYTHPDYANEWDSTGLSLTPGGELKGKPQYYGRFVFSIRAYNAAGEDIKTYILDVVEGAKTVVEVLRVPNKLDYYSGEKLDLTGLKVRVTKPDGTSFESKNGEKLTISTSTLVTLGEQKIKVAYGDAFDFFIVTVQKKPTKNPAITTKTLPEATVGQSYYVKLDCTDPDASFGEWNNPGAANDLSKTGLILTQHGELEGTPSEAGTYTFTICAVGEGGEGYMTYTMVVKEAEEETTDPTEPAEDPTEPTEDPTEPTEDPTESVTDPTEEPETAAPSDPSPQEDSEEKNDNKDGGNALIFVAIGLGVLVVGMVVAIVVILKKKKA